MPKHGMSMDYSRLHVIHVFSYSACVMIKQDGCIKHAPAAFVLMTRRKTEDYGREVGTY